MVLGAAPFVFGLRQGNKQPLSSKTAYSQVDFVGSFLLAFGATLLLVGVTLGGTLLEWSSAVTILLLVIGMSGLIVAGLWQRFGSSEPFMRQVSLSRRFAPFYNTRCTYADDSDSFIDEVRKLDTSALSVKALW